MSKTWLRRGCIAVAAVALLFIVAFAAAVPYVVRNALENTASRELGRKVTVQSISANPFLLRVTINGLAIAEAAPDPGTFVSIDRLAVAASLRSVFHRAPVLDAIEINGAKVSIARLGEQRFNFTDIIEEQQAKPKPATPGEPARFALYNIALTNGRIDFTDRLRGKTHQVADLAFGVPFLSNLPTHVAVKVQPSLSARVDGTPLVLRGESQPFHETRESAVTVKLDGLDIPTYLGYSPVPLNFALAQGKLDTDLRIAFRAPIAARDGQPAREAAVVISGLLGLREFDLQAPRASPRPLVRFQQLQLRVAEFAPLTQRVALDDVKLDAPEAWVALGSDGQLNWLRFVRSAVEPKAQAKADDMRVPAATPISPKPWEVTVRNAAVANGSVHLSDERLGRFTQELRNVQFGAQNISTVPNAPPGTLDLKVAIEPQGTVSLAGTLALVPLKGALDYAADDVQLRAAARYLASVIDGTLDGSARVRGKVVLEKMDDVLQLALRDLNVEGDRMTLRGPKESGAALDITRLALQGGAIDFTGRKITAANVTIDSPRVIVKRLADGTVGWQHLARPTAAAQVEAPAHGAGGDKPAAPWDVSIATVDLINGLVTWEDVSVSPVAKVALSSLTGTVRNVTAAGTTPMQLSLKARSSGGGAGAQAARGSLAVDGTARIKPLQTDLRVDVRNLDLAPARSYVTQFLNAVFVRGEVTSRSRVRLGTQDAGPLRLQLDGGLRVANLQALNADGADELLRWQALDVDRIDLKLGEGPADVQLGRIALADFFARVIVSPEGRLNLVDVVRRPGQDKGEGEGAESASSARQSQVAEAKAAAARGEAPDAKAPGRTDTSAGLRPRIRIERVEVTRGNINFTDNFIRPNYTANLTDITGSVTTLASDAAEPATLQLAGSVDREAPVVIEGRLNPLAPKLFLDIRGGTKGVDLPRFTPYSAKYAGYPIVKGKLSMDVSYKVENDKLAANNHLFLDQLTFGDKVDSPTATKLPVLLAVSLLKNTRGEIDINLPISGSLDDPKFSVGGIIVQVIVNVLTKIVTSPFTLLAAAFGSEAELGYVDFAPGSIALGPEQIKRLDTLAKALNDRPALRLDIIGRADSAADTAGIKRAQLDARLRAAKVRQQIRAGGASAAPESVTVEPAERNALLAVAYGDDKVVKKPRNAVGIARTLPAPEMEQLMIDAIAVTPSDLRALANARAAAVRDHLEQQGKVPRERLFLVEPKIDADTVTPPSDSKDAKPAGDAKDATGAKTVSATRAIPTRVDFSLK